MRLRRLLLLLPLLPVLLAAAPKADAPPDELVRKGNDAVRAGAFDAAERHFTDAEDSARDPGLVAFNKANALFHQSRLADAERHYTRALDDADSPPARRAAALYNRGVCQLKQGGIDKLRGAIDSFRRCLDANPDDRLRDDAKHNLEVAKLLWVAARAKESKKPTPNEQPLEPPPEPKRERPLEKDYDQFGQKDTAGEKTKGPGQVQPMKAGSKAGTPLATDQQTAGKGNAPVIKDGDRLPPDWTDDDVRRYLEGLAGRVAKDRRDTAALTAPPERPAVKDW